MCGYDRKMNKFIDPSMVGSRNLSLGQSEWSFPMLKMGILDNVTKSPGYITFSDQKISDNVSATGGAGITKILNPDYVKMLKIRDYKQDLVFRYLELRKEKTSVIAEFMSLFPYFNGSISMIEEDIQLIAQEIYQKYKERYIHGSYINIPQYQYIAMKNCHNWHVLDKHVNKISIEKVLEFIENLEVKILYRLILEFREEDSFLGI